MGLFSKAPVLNPQFIGLASQMSIDQTTANRLYRAKPVDMVNMTYTFVMDSGVQAKAAVSVTMKLDDPHKMLGEDPTMFDVLSILISQCVAARLE